jgi:NAD(P)H-nitrite reductase large subunit
LQTSRPDIYALGDCVGINGQSCRFIAPLRRQAETIAAEITGTEHSGYTHTNPVVRLKTRSVGVEVLGRPQPGAAWQVEADNADTLVLYQPQSGGQNARVTLTLRG